MMLLKKLVPIVGFCAVSFLSSSAMADRHVQELVNCATQRCMQAMQNGTVVVFKCQNEGGKADQLWHANAPKPGYIQNASDKFGKPCLSMEIGGVGGSITYKVLTTECGSPRVTQKWTFDLGEAGLIKNAKYGQCLAADKYGKYVEAASCNEADLNQMWGFAPVGEEPKCPGDSRMKLPQQAQPVPTMKLPNQAQPAPRMKLPKTMSPSELKPICSLNPPGSCLKDMNECGHPTDCQCPVAYTYNPATGQCDYSFNKVSTDTAETDNSGQCSFDPQSFCTNDINECGNPSFCACPLGYDYNPATRNCDLSVSD